MKSFINIYFSKAVYVVFILLVTGANVFCQSEIKITASDGASSDNFGQSVSHGDSVLVVGAFNEDDNGGNSGAVYVYNKSGDLWVETQKLLADDGQAGDQFGYSVCITGNYIAIGAPYVDQNGTDCGAVYIFEYNGTSWFQLDKILASDGAGGETFGYSLDAYNNKVIVGAKSDNDLGTNSGSAYIFRSDGFSWQEEKKLTASNGNSNDLFGFDVAIHGNHALVGANKADTNGTYSGAAYLYTFDGNDWSENAILAASDGGVNEFFGNSVDIYDSSIVVGAYKHSFGAAYLFGWDGSQWAQTQKIMASDGVAYDEYAYAVSIYKYRLAIGSIKDDDLGNNSGSVYLYQFDGAQWGQESKINASDGAGGDYYGNAISISGNSILIGANNDADNGSSSGSAYINELCGVTTSSNKQDVGCYSGQDGWAKVIANGGAIGYRYLWSNSSNTDSIFGLSKDTFFVTVSDSNSCMAYDTVFIDEPSSISLSKDSLDVDCEGNSTAWAKTNANGGTPPYSYLWNTGSASDSVFNLSEGIYTVLVKDGNLCEAHDTFNLSTRSRLSLNKDSSNLRCYEISEGYAKVMASNGIAPYSYSWSNASNSDSIGSLAAGVYSVTVQDGLSCSKSTSYNITQPNELSLVKDSGEVSCAGYSDAWAKVSVSGGTPSYTYSWSNMANQDSINGLSAGVYYISIQDSLSCSLVDSFNIPDRPLLELAKDSQNIICLDDSNAYVKISVIGGSPPYSYLWQDSSNTDSIGGLVAGNYSVSVTDAKTCSNSASFNIGIDAPLRIQVNIPDTSICYGDTAQLNVNFIDAGTPPYSYLWTPTAPLDDALIKNPKAFPLSNTSFIVKVDDHNNCSWRDTVQIDVNPALSFNISPDTFICFGESITLNPTLSDSGSSPLSYLWTPTSNLSNALIFNPSASPTTSQTYQLKITDANQCNAIDSIKINVNPEIAFNMSSDTLICFNDTAQLSANITGLGAGSLSYYWQPTASLNNALITNPIAFPADTTTYIFIATDMNNCSLTDSVRVLVNPKLEIDAGNDTTICYGDSLFMPSSQVFNGSGSLQYLWDPTPSLNNALVLIPVASPIDTTTYIVNVSDQNFCSDKDTITINVNPPLDISLNSDTFLCYIDSTQMISTIINGGTAPYNYNWDNGSFLSASNIANPWANPDTSTTFTLTITDLTNCQATANRTINVNPELGVDAGDDTLLCFGDHFNLPATILAYGSGSLQYAWNNSANLSNATILNPLAQTSDTTNYRIIVTDSIGCSVRDSLTVYLNPLITAAASVSSSFICYGDSVLISSSAPDQGTLPHTYYWSSTEAISDSSQQNTYGTPLQNTTYFIQISDASNCSAYDSVVVNVNPELNIDAGNDTMICYQDSIVIPASIIAHGTPPLSKTWTPFGILNDPNKLSPTAYPSSDTTLTLNVTDAQGCTQIDKIHISINQALSVSATADSFICYGDSSLLAATVGSPGSPPYNYSWSPSSLTSNPNNQQSFASPTSDSVFYVTVTDSIGCTAESSVPVSVSPTLIIEAGQNQLVCYGESFNLNAQIIANGIPPISLSWDNGSTLSDSSILNPSGQIFSSQNYTLTMTDAYNCSVSDQLTINLNPELGFNLSGDTFICYLDSGTINVNVVDSGTSPLSYVWSNPSTLSASDEASAKAAPLSQHTYGVTLTDANNCSVEHQHTLNVNPPLLVNVQSDTMICYNDSFQINASVLQDGSPPLHYAWQNHNSLNDIYILNPNAAPDDTIIYRLTVSDSRLCQSIDSFSVFVNPELDVLLFNDSLICYGDTLDLNPSIISYGSPPHTYSWSPNTHITALGNLSTRVFPDQSTTYILNTTDSSGCNLSDSVLVSVNPKLSHIINGGSFVCYGDSITLSSGIIDYGSPPYNYQWSHDSIIQNSTDSSSFAFPMQTTNFSLEITDSNNCKSYNTKNIVVNPPLNSQTINDTLICYGDSITLSSAIINNGTPPLNISWSPGASLSQSNILSPIAFPSDTTTYQLVVEDDSLCQSIKNITINVNPMLGVDVGNDTLICYGSQMQINSTIIGSGSGSLSIDWSPINNLSDSAVLSPLASPSSQTKYYLKVEDSNNCAALDSIHISVNPQLEIEINTDSFLCFNQSSPISQNIIYSGTPPYSYVWNDSSQLSFDSAYVVASPDSSQLVLLQIIDSNQCQHSDSVYITVNPEIDINISNDTLLCFGDSIQMVANTISAGSGSLSYQWTPSIGLNNPNISNPVCNIQQSTTYSLIVSDAMTCSFGDSVLIDINPEINVSIISDSLICYGDSLSLTAQLNAPGNGTISYMWNNSSMLNSPNSSSSLGFTDTTSVFKVIVQDISQCRDSAEHTIIVNPPLSISSGIDTFLCFGDSYQLNPTVIDSGAGGLSYHWTPEHNINNPNNANTHINAYQVILNIELKDVNGCISNDQLNINTSPQVILDAGADQLICYGQSVSLDASVNINGLSYLWTPTAPLNDATIEDPVALISDTTTFVLEFIDSSQCISYDTVTINITPELKANLSGDTLICYGDSISLESNLYHPDPSSLDYLWTPTANLSDATILEPHAFPSDTTTYSLRLLDTHGCITYDSIKIFTTPLITLDSGNDTLVCPNDTLTLNASISQNIQYINSLSWTPSNHLSDAHVLNPLVYAHPSTTYKINAFDIFGCLYSDSVIINRSPALSFDLGPDELICYGDSIQTPLNITNPGAGSYQYLWLPSNSVSDVSSQNPYLNPTDTTNYIVTIIDGNNCSASDQITINVSPSINVDAGQSVVVCYDDSSTLSAQMTMPGLPPYNVIWTPTTGLDDALSMSPKVGHNSAHLYYVVVTDANNCSTIDSVSIINNLPLDVFAGNDTLICYGKDLQLDAQITTGQSYQDLNVVWTPTTGLSNAVVLNPNVFTQSGVNNYSISIIDSNQCVSTDDITIVANPELFLDLGNDITICANTYYEPSFTFSSPSTYPLEYNWTSLNAINNPDTIEPIIHVLGNDLLILNVTDHNSCEISDTMLINNFPLFNVQVTDDTVLCVGGSLQLNSTLIDSGTPSYSYSWNNSSFLSNPNISNPICFPGSPSTFVLTATDGNSCISVDSVEVVFNPLLDVDLGNDTSVCLNDSLGLLTTLNGAGTPPYSLHWSETSFISDTNNLTPFVSPSQSQQLNLIVTDANLCSSMDSIMISVNPSLNIQVLDDTLICQGDSINLGVLFIDQGQPPYTYAWNPSHLISDTTIAYPIVFPENNTMFELTVTDGNNCRDSDEAEVTVSQFSYKVINGPTSVSHLDTFGYSTLNTAGSSFNWFVEGGNIVSGNGSNSVIVAWGPEGSGKLSFVEINSYGCESDTIFVNVEISWGVGLKAYNTTQISIYPNPAQEKATIKGSSNDLTKYNIEVYNQVGQLVWSENSAINQGVNINGSEIGNNGVFVVKINGKNQTYQKRVLFLGGD